MGRNGAGKSTTLSLLLGLDRPDSGDEVRGFGRAPERAVRDGLVGAMLQDAAPDRSCGRYEGGPRPVSLPGAGARLPGCRHGPPWG